MVDQLICCCQLQKGIVLIWLILRLRHEINDWWWYSATIMFILYRPVADAPNETYCYRSIISYNGWHIFIMLFCPDQSDQCLISLPWSNCITVAIYDNLLQFSSTLLTLEASMSNLDAGEYTITFIKNLTTYTTLFCVGKLIQLNSCKS